MKLPEQYKNLTFQQKKIIVANLISCYWNKEIKDLLGSLWEKQVNFLFKYFFTESKEIRERMWDDIQREYESTIKEIEYIAKKIQMLNLQYREFLASKEDIKNFMNNK